MTTEITNTQNTLDSRDIQERIDELTELKERLADEGDPMNEDEQDELDKLVSFKDEVDSSEWNDGIQFISEDYFEDYAKEFAEDIGAIGRDMQWPANCIDWEAAADVLRMDYNQADFDGQAYLYR